MNKINWGIIGCGDVTEIKLIDPKDYKKYFDWSSVGDRLMEQALLLKSGM